METANRLFVALDRFGLEPELNEDPKGGEITVSVPSSREHPARHLIEAYGLDQGVSIGDLMTRLQNMEKSYLDVDRRSRLIEIERQLWEYNRSRDLESLTGVVRASVSVSLPAEPSLDDAFAGRAPEPPVIAVRIVYSTELVGAGTPILEQMRRDAESIVLPAATASGARVQVSLVPRQILTAPDVPGGEPRAGGGFDDSRPPWMLPLALAILFISGSAGVALVFRLAGRRSSRPYPERHKDFVGA